MRARAWLPIVILTVVGAAVWWMRPQKRSMDTPAAETIEHAPVRESSPPAREIEPAAPAVTITAPVSKPEQIRAALAETFRARYPERSVSDAELDRMSAALMRLARARAALSSLRYEPSEGGELRRLRDEIGEAIAEFETVAGMPLERFTREGSGGGITPGDAVEDEVVFETMEEAR